MRRDAASITDDIQRRSAHIHWPGDVSPDRADLFAHNDIVVNAPADVIWSHLVRASAWPSWYSNASGHDLWNISLKFLCESQCGSAF